MTPATATKMTLGRLDIAMRREPAGHDVVVLTGQIDEQATLSDLVGDLGGRVVVDLEGVKFVNSIGVREWIMFLAALADRGAAVVLRACSEAMVHQMNMVVEARGAAEVESFHAPFLCDGCAGERSVVIPVGPHRADLLRHHMPTQRCPDCGGSMQLDDFPNRYLLFLE